MQEYNILLSQYFRLPLEVNINQVNNSQYRHLKTRNKKLRVCHRSAVESYHVREVVRVHLIQVLIIDVGIGKVKPVG